MSASELVIIQTPLGSTGGQRLPTQPVLELRDASGRVVGDSSATVMASLKDARGATLGGTTTQTFSGGRATFADLTIDRVGNHEIEFATSTVGLTASVFVDIAIGPAVQVGMTTPPSSVARNLVMDELRVAIQDAGGNTVVGADTEISLAINSGTGAFGATLRGTTTRKATDGEAVFDDLSIDASSPGYVIEASALGLSTTLSEPFEIIRPLEVPATYATIQEAIDAALPGDPIEVAPGTYSGPGNIEIDFSGKAILVYSANGAGATIIDCDSKRGFVFQSGETHDSVLRGFTIQNGYFLGAYGDGGGGIRISNSSPTIADCTVVNCYGSGGGGILSTSGAPRIVRCTISNNRAGYGAGVAIVGGSAQISDSTFESNDSDPYDGGGLYFESTTVAMERCRVSGNRALMFFSSFGGGIFAHNSDLRIESSLIAANLASAHGFNVSSAGGAGIYSDSSNLNLHHVTIVGNSASASSPPVYGPSWSAGGGLYIDSGGSCSIDSCIISGNGAATARQAWIGSSTILIRYSNVLNSANDIFGVTFIPGQDGNVSSDPMFENDYRLRNGSPCIDTGNPASSVTTDITGGPRPGPGGPPDMGAYERDA